MAGRFTARRILRTTRCRRLRQRRQSLCARGRAGWSRRAVRRSRQPAVNPLLSDKLLDAKVRLHRRLIEEINLSALEKLPEDEIRAHVQALVAKYVMVERLALNAQELADFVSEILDEMTGPRPARAVAQGPKHQRHPHQRP